MSFIISWIGDAIAPTITSIVETGGVKVAEGIDYVANTVDGVGNKVTGVVDSTVGATGAKISAYGDNLRQATSASADPAKAVGPSVKRPTPKALTAASTKRLSSYTASTKARSPVTVQAKRSLGNAATTAKKASPTVSGVTTSSGATKTVVSTASKPKATVGTVSKMTTPRSPAVGSVAKIPLSAKPNAPYKAPIAKTTGGKAVVSKTPISTASRPRTAKAF